MKMRAIESDLEPRSVSDLAEVCEICEPCRAEDLLVLQFYPQSELRCDFGLGNSYKVVSKSLVKLRVGVPLYTADSSCRYTRILLRAPTLAFSLCIRYRENDSAKPLFSQLSVFRRGFQAGLPDNFAQKALHHRSPLTRVNFALSARLGGSGRRLFPRYQKCWSSSEVSGGASSVSSSASSAWIWLI